MTVHTYVVDTVSGNIKDAEGPNGAGLILACDKAAAHSAGRLWASRVVLLGTEPDGFDDLVDRISAVMLDTHDMNVTDECYALAIAAELLGKDVDEERARRKGE